MKFSPDTSLTFGQFPDIPGFPTTGYLESNLGFSELPKQQVLSRGAVQRHYIGYDRPSCPRRTTSRMIQH